MSTDKTAVNQPDPESGSSTQAKPGSGQHQPVTTKGSSRKPSPRPPGDGRPPSSAVRFTGLSQVAKDKESTWSDQVTRQEREQTLSATDIVGREPQRGNLINAAAKAAGEAEALRVRAEAAKEHAAILQTMAQEDDIVVSEDHLVLVRKYSDETTNNSVGSLAMPTKEFAEILANMDRLSVPQLKILSSTVNSLLGITTTASVVSVSGPIQSSIGGRQCQPPPKGTSFAGRAAMQPTTQGRGRQTSRIRANPTQGGVRTNQKGGRIDYDNRTYTSPTGRRFRMQAPKPKPADLLKAESQVQTIVRRLKAFVNAKGISNESLPLVGSEDEQAYKGLLDELDSSKKHFKEVRSSLKLAKQVQ